MSMVKSPWQHVCLLNSLKTIFFAILFQNKTSELLKFLLNLGQSSIIPSKKKQFITLYRVQPINISNETILFPCTEFSLAISQWDGTVYTVSESRWGAMCHYDDNGAEVALVICRELGFTEGEVIPGEETVQGPVLSINYCHGFESSIRDCRTQPLGGNQCFPIQRITKVNCFNGADLLDDGNVYDSVPYSPDDGK